MIKQMALATKEDQAIEARLYRGVIARTIEDWLAKPLRPKREAERYLFQNSADLTLICGSAGINIERLRTCLNKVRGQTLLEVLHAAASPIIKRCVNEIKKPVFETAGTQTHSLLFTVIDSGVVT